MSIRSTLFVATLALALTGPAVAQDAGARMATEAGQTGDRAHSQADLAKQWKKGEKLTLKGQKLVRKSEGQITSFSRSASKHQAEADRAVADGRKASASLAEGRRMVAAGARLKAQAENQFPQIPAA